MEHRDVSHDFDPQIGRAIAKYFTLSWRVREQERGPAEPMLMAEIRPDARPQHNVRQRSGSVARAARTVSQTAARIYRRAREHRS